MKELTKTQIAKINGGFMDSPAAAPTVPAPDLTSIKATAENQQNALSNRMRGIS